MAKIMVLGDVHHNYPSVERAIEASKHVDYSKIVQVGDFGLWDHEPKGLKFLDDTNSLLAHHGRKIYAIGGNHENWNHWNWYIENMPRDYESGFRQIRSHIFIAPRTHRWVWYKKQFVAVAGAASIDRDVLVEGFSWWSQEQITDAEIDGMVRTPTDYFFSHDCSNRTPWDFKLIPDMQSMIHRERIDRALKHTVPKVHFHGHMHRRIEWMNPTGERAGDINWTQTYGMECNHSKNVWGILDTETNGFEYHPTK